MREGFYERLVCEGEQGRLERLIAEVRALVDDLSDAARRDLLLDA